MSAKSVAEPVDTAEPAPGWSEWGGVVLLCLGAVLAAVLEALFTPLYVGSVILPVVVLASLASNILLPRLARILVPSTLAAALPFVAWLITIIGFGVLARPEGDVILPGSPQSVELVTYGVLLGGALAGTITVVATTPGPAAKGSAAKGSAVSGPAPKRPAPRKGPTLRK